MRLAIAGLLLLSLSGCALAPAVAIPLYLGAASLSITALHDCHMDGGCKEIPLPP